MFCDSDTKLRSKNSFFKIFLPDHIGLYQIQLQVQSLGSNLKVKNKNAYFQTLEYG